MGDELLAAVDRKVVEALKLREQGQSWRAAAKAVRMDASNLWKAAKARGYHEHHESNRQRFAELWSEIAEEAGRQLLERLHQGEKLSAKELAVVGGIGTDKVAAAEGWNRPAPSTSNWLETFAERLSTLTSVRLTLETAPPPPKAVDVTPSNQLLEGTVPGPAADLLPNESARPLLAGALLVPGVALKDGR